MQIFILILTLGMLGSSVVLTSADTNRAANPVNSTTTTHARGYKAVDWGQRMIERPSGQVEAANVGHKGSGGHDDDTKGGDHGHSEQGGHAQEAGDSQSRGRGQPGVDGQAGKAGQPRDSQRAERGMDRQKGQVRQ